MADKNIDYEDLKRRGFLKQWQDTFFALRTRTSGGVYSKEALEEVARIASRYGRGIIHPTTRQGLEIPFIKFDDIPEVEKAIKDAGIETGTSGPRLRAITCCPGNNWCKQGLVNTFSLLERIEKELGMRCGLDLPHKFKIAVSGCPNGCTRPQAAEIGIHGQADANSPDRRIGFAVYIGGSAGRSPKSGFRLEGLFTEDETLAVIRKTVAFFKERAKPRQRLGALIEEAGMEVFLKAVLGR